MKETLDNYESPIRKTLTLGEHIFNWGQRTYIMAIMNITPDSFTGDGLLESDDVIEASLAKAKRALAEGADILDIGGVASGSSVSIRDEIARVVPVIKAIAQEVPLPISIDSCRPEVVAEAIDAGAHIVNSDWGLRTYEGAWNEPLAKLVATHGVPLILTHNRKAQSEIDLMGTHSKVESNDLMTEVVDELKLNISYAKSVGIATDRLIVDPGFGHFKTPEQDLTLLRRLAELRCLGLPILIGASRKSFITYVLGSLPYRQRDIGTAAVTVIAVLNGVDIARVHNVHINVQSVKIADTLIR